MMKFSLALLALSLFAVVRCRNLHLSTNETAFVEESSRIRVCIDKLGCFQESNPNESFPVSDFLEKKWFMSSRERVGTEFRWWAPGKQRATVMTNFNYHVYFEERDPKYDRNLKAIFIVHGYQGGNAPWAVEMKDAIMKREPANVFIVDWSGGDGLLYGTARANTWIVGAELARLIERIMIRTGMTLDKVHIIGHSLGSHAAGFAGKWLKQKLGGKKVRRITGLDVAGPDFQDYEVGRRLDRSDAEFVDTIHTNAAKSYIDGFGIVKPVGHFDFFPNGGELQPGCPTSMEAVGGIAEESLEFISSKYKMITIMQGDKRDIGDAFESLSCNHGRAIQFFIESIGATTCNFFAEECISWKDYLSGKCRWHLHVQMGYDSERYTYYMNPSGSYKFYLETNSRSPFCKERGPLTSAYWSS